VHAQEHAASTAPVRAEFRVFAGFEEITASTRLRITPTGKRDKPVTLPEAKALATDLSPGIYDVQALHVRHGAIVGIRWAERLVVMHYPDEAGRHLEVINFQPGFGALQLRAADGDIENYDITVFPTASRGEPAAAPRHGNDYRLFILRAGRYDIRVRHAGVAEDAGDAQWFLDVEVPADRTRIKFVGS
jgi:hypothetical protein